MKKSREQAIAEVANALYDYVVAKQSATHNGKRPGLKWEHPEDVDVASCGAYREWAIFAVHKRLAIAADGYRVRDNSSYGRQMFVHAGEGKIRFPSDDSRSHHSLSLKLQDIPDGCTGSLIDVTREEGPWDELLPEITNRLNAATLALARSVSEYDANNDRLQEESRKSDLEKAIAAFM